MGSQLCRRGRGSCARTWREGAVAGRGLSSGEGWWQCGAMRLASSRVAVLGVEAGFCQNLAVHGSARNAGDRADRADAAAIGLRGARGVWLSVCHLPACGWSAPGWEGGGRVSPLTLISMTGASGAPGVETQVMVSNWIMASTCAVIGAEAQRRGGWAGAANGGARGAGARASWAVTHSWAHTPFPSRH